MRKIRLKLFFIFLSMFLACLSSCAGGSSSLVAEKKASADYTCENGILVRADYYSLADGSLDFVRLSMPDDMTYTLPAALSASGVRYTGDADFTWWIKGNTAFGETRDNNGDWQVTYKNCVEIR